MPETSLFSITTLHACKTFSFLPTRNGVAASFRYSTVQYKQLIFRCGVGYDYFEGDCDLLWGIIVLRTRTKIPLYELWA